MNYVEEYKKNAPIPGKHSQPTYSCLNGNYSSEDRFAATLRCRVIKTSLQALRLFKMLKGGTSTSKHTSLLLGFKGTEKCCCKNRLKKIKPRTRTYLCFKKYHPPYRKRQQLLTHS